MENFILSFDSKTIELEQKNQWIAAAEIAYQKWKKNPMDLNNIVCAGTELWYSLIQMDNCFLSSDSFNSHNADKNILQIQLMEITQYGFDCFSNNSIFNVYFGYMIKVMPYLFIDYCGDYCGWQAKGISMIKKAYELEPTNLFVKAMYYELEDCDEAGLFYEACKLLWTCVTPEEWGYSEVSQYFFRILHGESF